MIRGKACCMQAELARRIDLLSAGQLGGCNVGTMEQFDDSWGVPTPLEANTATVTELPDRFQGAATASPLAAEAPSTLGAWHACFQN